MVNAPGNMHQGRESRSTTNQLAYRVMSGKKKRKKPAVSMVNIDVGGVVIIASAGEHVRAYPEVPVSSSRLGLSQSFRVVV